MDCQHPNRIEGGPKRDRYWHCAECGDWGMLDSRPRCAFCGRIIRGAGRSIPLTSRTTGHELGRICPDGHTFALTALAGIEPVFADKDAQRRYAPWHERFRPIGYTIATRGAESTREEIAA
jgi:hypothetical protein